MIHQKKIKVGVTILTGLLFAQIYSVNSLTLYKEVTVRTQEAEQLTTEKLVLSDATTTITSITEEGTTSSYFTTEYTPSENSTENNEEQTTPSVTTELSMTTEEQLHDQSTIISINEETTQCSQSSTGFETGNEAPELLVRTETPVTENVTPYDENEKSTTLPSDVEDNTASYEISTVKQTDEIEGTTQSVLNENLIENNNEKKWIDDGIVLPAIDERQQPSTNILVENKMIVKTNLSLSDLILLKNQQMEKEYQSTTMINITEKDEVSSTDKPTTENYY